MFDLFSDIKSPQIDYGKLMDQMKNRLFCSQQVINYVLIRENHQTIRHHPCKIRSDLIIVGPIGDAKTSNYKDLVFLMTIFKNLEKYEKVNYHILNPKIIKMVDVASVNQLFSGNGFDYFNVFWVW